jgi:predicted ATPase/DNA-binding SARP family transcriptional activator/DNA-binding CsgD family transcriptional regulator
MNQPAELQIRLLGGFQVDVVGQLVAPSAWRRRAAAVVKLLALAPRHQLHPEQVMESLWPELAPAGARNNLHRTLHTARRILEPARRSGAPPAFLCLRGDMLALAASASVWVDVTAFEAAAERARATRDRSAYEAALRSYTGDLLPDDRYEDWAAAKREDLRRCWIELLLELAGVQRAQGDDGAAIATLRRVIASEPTHEGAHLELMRRYLAGGRRGDALRLYRQLREALSSEFGVAPDAAIERLYGSILVGDAPLDLGGDGGSAGPLGPAPTPPETPPANFPLQLTSFVGREREVNEIIRLLGATRLLTLLGPGGCGKTRLAVEVAARLRASYPDGVWWLELASLEDGALVPDALMHSFGLRPEPGRTTLQTVGDHLRDRHVLLVLDNCEHLVSACAGLVATLLRVAPGLRVLATSRTALNATGELTWFVPALSSPNPRRLPPTDRLPDYGAVRLFLDRASAVRPGLELTEADAPWIAQICARLEGLPLALELAAARVRVLAPGQIAERLDDCLGLLSHGSRTVSPRHQTLRGVLDWSHTLLSAKEQILFRRLAVFAGGFTLEAAEAVCGPQGSEVRSCPDPRPQTPDPCVLDGLSVVVEQSLVVAEEHGTARRYRLLEPIRQYAAEKLTQSCEAATTRDRHLAWFLSFAETAAPDFVGAATWLDRIEVEQDNLRAALRWAQDGGHHGAGLRLAAALWRFWWTRSHLKEGRAWLEAFLERTAGAAEDLSRLPTRANALLGAGVLASTQGDQPRAKTWLEESLACWQRVGDEAGVAAALEYLAAVAQNQADRRRAVALIGESLALRRRLGDRHGVANALHRLGSLARDLGRYERADDAFAESLRLYRDLGDVAGTAQVLSTWGRAVRDRGDFARAVALQEKALALFRELGAAYGISRSLNLLGIAAWEQGEAERALDLHEEALELAREVGDRWGAASSLCFVGYAALTLGDAARARRSLEEALAQARDLGDLHGSTMMLRGLGAIALAVGDWEGAAARYGEALRIARRIDVRAGLSALLEGAAHVATGLGRAEEAVRLYAAAEGLREAVGTPRPVPERAAHEAAIAAARAALSDATFAVAWAMGRRLRSKRAVGEALALLGSVPRLANASLERAAEESKALTRREREIAALVARGLTNRAIATELGIAERTADTHVANILAKLGLHSRADVATWLVRSGMGRIAQERHPNAPSRRRPAGGPRSEST